MNDLILSTETHREDYRERDFHSCHQNQPSKEGHSHRHGMGCGGKWHKIMMGALIVYIIVTYFF